jgi:hypothetical protein
MIKAFGTSPCYFDGRDEGISDPKHITWWCLLLHGDSMWPRILETCWYPSWRCSTFMIGIFGH